MTPCPECIDGRGLVTLFSSVRPCRTCAARRAEAAKAPAPTVTFSGIVFDTNGRAVRWDHVNGGTWTAKISPF